MLNLDAMRSILIILTLTFNSLFAQISIDSADMPVSGDTLRYSVTLIDTTILLNYTQTGANQTWNFNNLTPDRQAVRSYINSSQTPYNSITNRLGEKLADTLALGVVNLYDVYEFYNTTASGFINDYRGASVPTGLSFPFPTVLRIDQAYSNPDEVYQFPLQYLDRDSSTYNFTYSNFLIGAYLGSNGYRINEVDGWGSITTPYGTFNCIKVVTDVVGFDTVSFGTNNFGIPSHTREYKWLTPSLNMPVMTVRGNVIANTFIPTLVEYRDSLRSGVPNLFAPLALFFADTTEGIVGDTFNLFNSTVSLSPSTFQWNISPSTFTYLNGTSSSSESPIVNFQDTGLYTVGLIANNGFGSDTLTLTNYIRIVSPTSIKEAATIVNELYYPNPVKAGGIVNLRNNQHITNYQLFSIDGKRVLHSTVTNSILADLQISIPDNLQSGNYLLRIQKNDTVEIIKLLIR